MCVCVIEAPGIYDLVVFRAQAERPLGVPDT